MAPFANKPLLLFGGSFDPVHQAHIKAALAASQALNNAPVAFLPNALSPLKQSTHANSEQRLAMLELALAPYSQLSINRFEVDRPAPSYTIDTLQHFKQSHPNRPLVLVIGADSLASLNRWRDWQLFSSLCHLLVLPRPQSKEPSADVLTAFSLGTAADLINQRAGLRLMLEAPFMDLSSTEIRQRISEGDLSQVPNRIKDYIVQQQLYL